MKKLPISSLRSLFPILCCSILFCIAPTSDAASSSKTSKKSKVTNILTKYFVKDKPVLGEVGNIVPPKEINKYIAKVQAASKEDPEWYNAYSKKAKPGLPLPWNEKLGLTKNEYEEYLKLWRQRQFKVARKVVMRLEEVKPGEWMIRVSGVGTQISLLHYFPKTDQFKSPNGFLKRIEDVDASKDSILGAWKGQEWRFEEKNDFEWTTENLALGKYNDGSYGLLIYRVREVISGFDKSMVIRFTLPKHK